SRSESLAPRSSGPGAPLGSTDLAIECLEKFSKTCNVLAIALANKLARMVWAILHMVWIQPGGSMPLIATSQACICQVSPAGFAAETRVEDVAGHLRDR